MINDGFRYQWIYDILKYFNNIKYEENEYDGIW